LPADLPERAGEVEQVNKLSGRTRHIDELIKEVEGRIKDSSRLEKPKKGKWYLAPLLSVLAGAAAYYAYSYLSQSTPSVMSSKLETAPEVSLLASTIPSNRMIPNIISQESQPLWWREETASPIANVLPTSHKLLSLKPSLVTPKEILDQNPKSQQPIVQPPMTEALKPYTTPAQKTIKHYPSRLELERTIKQYPSREPLSKRIQKDTILRLPPPYNQTTIMRAPRPSYNPLQAAMCRETSCTGRQRFAPRYIRN
jgi:hypothetical protein